MKKQSQNQNCNYVAKNIPITDIYISTRVSKNGKSYCALYVVDENDNEHFITFIKKKGEN